MANKVFVSKLTTKKGKYGKSKVKVFLLLSKIQPDRYLTCRALCIHSGITYYSLARALSRWYSFGYVNRTVFLGSGSDYMYCILSRGRSWLRVAEANLPNYKLFVSELAEWQSTLTQERTEELMSMPFMKFVKALDEAINSTRGKILA